MIRQLELFPPASEIPFKGVSEMKAASVHMGLTGPAKAVRVDGSVSVSAQEPGRASDPPANIAIPEGESSTKELKDA